MSLYLFLTFLSIVVQGFFAFFEMGCVSFNKVRLQYYVSLKTKRALWINYLLKSPYRLFGTTLVGITASLVFGSECARHLYEALGFNPDFAFLTQVPLVVILGELAPMFAARRHPEQAAMFCVPVMVVLAKFLTPITWTFDAFSNLVYRIVGKKNETPFFLTREEVRMAFEEQDVGTDEFNAAVSQIFRLKTLTAKELMTPLDQVQMVSTQATLAEVRHLLSVHYTAALPIYHRDPHNIVGMASLRSLLSLSEGKKVIDTARSPWFVTRDTPILQILQQFRRNNQSTTVVLDGSGQAVGILWLDQIFSEIFGEEEKKIEEEREKGPYIDRTLSAEMTVGEFQLQFHAFLSIEEEKSLGDFLLSHLDHLPVKEESIRIANFEFTIEEVSLRGIKTVSVRSVLE